MNFLKKAAAYIRREPWTALMIAVLLSAMIAGWAATRHSSGAEPSAGTPDIHSEAMRLETTQKIEDWGQQIAEDPKYRMTLGLITLLVAAVITLGLVWGSALLASIRRGERWMEKFSEPRATWGIHEAFKALIFLFFLDIVFSTVLAFAFSAAGIQTTNLALMSGSLLRSVVMTVWLGWKVRRLGGSWADLGVCGRRPGRQIFWGLAGYLALIPVYLLSLGVLIYILSLFHIKTPVQQPVQILYTEPNAAAVMGFAVFMGILGPWFEEIFFRGFIYPAFKNRVGVVRGILASSVLFAALHGHGIAFIPILILGIALNILYERSGSIIPGAVLHMTHNSVMLAFAMAIRQGVGTA